MKVKTGWTVPRMGEVADCFTDRRPLSQIGGLRAYFRQVWASLKALWR